MLYENGIHLVWNDILQKSELIDRSFCVIGIITVLLVRNP